MEEKELLIKMLSINLALFCAVDLLLKYRQCRVFKKLRSMLQVIGITFMLIVYANSSNKYLASMMIFSFLIYSEKYKGAMNLNIDKAFGIVQKKETVNGVEYTLQSMPLKLYYKMRERCRDANGNLMASELYDEIFSNVIVAPKVSFDNFNNVEELEELMGACLRFLEGRDRNKQETEGNPQE